jgi:hypothetical protein
MRPKAADGDESLESSSHGQPLDHAEPYIDRSFLLAVEKMKAKEAAQQAIPFPLVRHNPRVYKLSNTHHMYARL